MHAVTGRDRLAVVRRGAPLRDFKLLNYRPRASLVRESCVAWLHGRASFGLNFDTSNEGVLYLGCWVEQRGWRPIFAC